MSSPPVAEGDLLWTPSHDGIARTQLADFQRWLVYTRGIAHDGYESLWRWSVQEPAAFWGAIWEYFRVESAALPQSVMRGDSMRSTRWFEGARLNYAQHALRAEMRQPDAIAVRYISEQRPLASMSWRTLGGNVRRLAECLRALGVKPGDRVAAILTNTPEAVIALLATASIGAVWAAAAPEFGVGAVVDRFAQIEPVVLFAVGQYRFAGRENGREATLVAVAAALPSLRVVVRVDAGESLALPSSIRSTTWHDLMSGVPSSREAFQFEQVPADHPLWILFSSGTTGLPKAIVHGHAGMLVEHFKVLHLHFDLRPGKTLFFHTTTGWMIWNLVVAALLTGATTVLYDGSPVHPELSRLWQIAAQAGVTHFGASPTYVQLLDDAGVRPAESFDLGKLEVVTVSGSPCSPESFAWIYRHVKADVAVSSQSGGTEICSAFVGAVPTLPVRAGEIQARMLGMDVECWDETGHAVVNEVGELVVRTAFPSMPLRFWNDEDGSRYRAAYFERFAGVWRHGDHLKINDRGGCFIYGRSDATLNRHGVRIGTAEVYRVLERMPGVADSLVVCLQRSLGELDMPLFVVLRPGVTLDDDMKSRIRERLRVDCSPRHVPDSIIQAPAIPYTLTGKKMEVPVRRILEGESLERVASRDAMRDPAALHFFMQLARRGAM